MKGQGKKPKSQPKPKPKQDKKHSKVYKELETIKKDAKPLAPGERAKPTSIVYIEGELIFPLSA